MDDVPAVWRVVPGADQEKLGEVLGRLAPRLEIDSPKVQGDYVFRPADYPRVAGALDQVEPDWRDESLLLLPEP